MENSTFLDLGRLGKLSTGPISVVSVVSAVADASPADLFHTLSPIPDNLEEVILFEFNTYAWGIDEVRPAIRFSNLVPLTPRPPLAAVPRSVLRISGQVQEAALLARHFQFPHRSAP